MPEHDLDSSFEEAFEKASNISKPLAPDVMLKLYAYYKHATLNRHKFRKLSDSDNLRNAFKSNALMQVSHLSKDDAKKKYIALVNEILNQ